MRTVSTNGRTLGELFRDLKDDATYLFRQEVELAKTEVKENARRVARDFAVVVAGGVLLWFAGLAFLAFLCVGAIALLAQVMDDAVAAWLGPLLVALVLGVAGWITVAVGKNRLREDEVAPDETIESMKENKAWVKEQLTSR